MLALLRTRRWLAFTALVIVAIVAFGLLSRWQWARAEQHRQERIDVVSRSAQEPVTIDQALSQSDAGSWEWVAVSATGTYVPDSTRLVRQRPLDGSNGFWVVTTLRLGDGRTVAVCRGWIPVTGAATQAQSAPPPPDGQVTVVGRLRSAEVPPSQVPSDLPSGQVPTLSPELLGATITQAYVEQASTTPPDSSVKALPLPEIDEVRNVSYAVQWILFALVALVGWFYFLRREAREDAST